VLELAHVAGPGVVHLRCRPRRSSAAPTVPLAVRSRPPRGWRSAPGGEAIAVLHGSDCRRPDAEALMAGTSSVTASTAPRRTRARCVVRLRDVLGRESGVLEEVEGEK
jgi:hypothetical protein